MGPSKIGLHQQLPTIAPAIKTDTQTAMATHAERTDAKPATVNTAKTQLAEAAKKASQIPQRNGPPQKSNPHKSRDEPKLSSNSVINALRQKRLEKSKPQQTPALPNEKASQAPSATSAKAPTEASKTEKTPPSTTQRSGRREAFQEHIKRSKADKELEKEAERSRNLNNFKGALDKLRQSMEKYPLKSKAVLMSRIDECVKYAKEVKPARTEDINGFEQEMRDAAALMEEGKVNINQWRMHAEAAKNMTSAMTKLENLSDIALPPPKLKKQNAAGAKLGAKPKPQVEEESSSEKERLDARAKPSVGVPPKQTAATETTGVEMKTDKKDYAKPSSKDHMRSSPEEKTKQAQWEKEVAELYKERKIEPKVDEKIVQDFINKCKERFTPKPGVDINERIAFEAIRTARTDSREKHETIAILDRVLPKWKDNEILKNFFTTTYG